MQVGGAMVAQMVRWGIRFHQMIPATLGGQATLANVFVTHRWCQLQYH
jgi:hypothetical protein